MSERGRPELPPEQRRRHRVRVYLNDAELALLDRVRGDFDRSHYMTLLLLLDARQRGERV